MRHLIAVRHAKSSWSDHSTPDHDRPLNARGRRAAPAVAAALREAGHVPDLVHSSTSARTRETWKLMAPAFADERGPAFADQPSPAVAREPSPAFAQEPEARFHAELYLASIEAILEIVAATPPEVETLMVLGHNPSIFQLASGLSQRGDTGERRTLSRGMPTGAAAVIALDGDGWIDAARGGELVKLILPRRLEDS